MISYQINTTITKIESSIRDAIKYCKDIGMFALDRPRKSCKWRTDFCRKNCYNNKFDNLPNIAGKDMKNAKVWFLLRYQTKLSCEAFKNVLNEKKNDTSRFRLCTRGEAITDLFDVNALLCLADTLPNTTFWVPTRAWRNNELYDIIVKKVFPVSNIKILASIDPSNTLEEINALQVGGWSTMFFGDDKNTDGRFLCPKTHGKVKKSCLSCKNGCFSDYRVDVHLKKH